jgi:hypothetical protein
MPNKVTKRQFLVTVSGIPGNWRTMTGGGATASPTKDYSGGADKPDLLSGPAENEDIVLVRTYDHDLDKNWIADWRHKVGRQRASVTKHVTDMYLSPIKNAGITYPNCLLSGLTEPEVDASSSDPGEITLTFANTGIPSPAK